MTVVMLWLLVIYVTLVYAPIAAWLVELFPSRIRYSGMSLPYHIGNGWFGGFLPATVFAIVASTGNIYSGLWYPIIIALMSLVVGFLFLPETKDVDITKTDLVPEGGRKSRPRGASAAGFLLRAATRAGLADELDDDLAAMRTPPVLDQVDRLPRAEHELALHDRNLQRGRREHGFDMGRHVVGALGVVAPSEVFRGETIERSGQILQHRRIGILLNRQRSRGVTNEQRQLAFDCTHLLGELRDLGRQIDKAAARGVHVKQRRHDRTRGNRRRRVAEIDNG